jgi:hypothetical protein
MNCDEAREIFAELVVDEFGLSESATVEAHAGQCAECAQVLDQLCRTAPRGHGKRPVALAQISARPSRRSRSLTRYATVTAVLVLVLGLGILAVQQRYDVWLAGLRIALQSLSEMRSSATDSRAQAAPQELLTPPDVASPIERTPQDAAPTGPAAPAPRAKPEAVPESASPAKASGMTEAGPAKRAVPARAVKPEPAVESVSPTVASRSDVVIQLSVQDRREAERHVKTLITRLGGMRNGRERAAAMELVVPRAKYGELTRGLAQIGAWQMESDAGPLPDPVHVAVRLAR